MAFRPIERKRTGLEDKEALGLDAIGIEISTGPNSDINEGRSDKISGKHLSAHHASRPSDTFLTPFNLLDFGCRRQEIVGGQRNVPTN